MDAPHGHWLNGWRKRLTATTQECWEQFWTNPGGNTLQSNSCTATNPPSRKLPKLDEPDMQDPAGEVGRAHKWCTPLGLPHVCVQKQGDQLEHEYSSSVRIRDVTLRTYQKRWTIGRSGERGSGISVLVARNDYEKCLPPTSLPIICWMVSLRFFLKVIWH